MSPLFGVVLSEVPPASAGAASGVLTTTQQVALALGRRHPGQPVHHAGGRRRRDARRLPGRGRGPGRDRPRPGPRRPPPPRLAPRLARAGRSARTFRSSGHRVGASWGEGRRWAGCGRLRGGRSRWADRGPVRPVGEQDLVDEGGGEAHQGQEIEVVAGHGAGVGRAAPGVHGEVGVQAADHLLARAPEAVDEQQGRQQGQQDPAGRARTPCGRRAGRLPSRAGRAATAARCAGRSGGGAATGPGRAARWRRRPRRGAATRRTSRGRTSPGPATGPGS